MCVGGSIPIEGSELFNLSYLSEEGLRHVLGNDGRLDQLDACAVLQDGDLCGWVGSSCVCGRSERRMVEGCGTQIYLGPDGCGFTYIPRTLAPTVGLGWMLLYNA